MSDEKKVIRKKIKSTGIMNKYMADYFLELDRCSKTGEKRLLGVQVSVPQSYFIH